MPLRLCLTALAAALALAGCEDSRCQQVRDSCGLDNDGCGPSEAVVKRIVDGDTVELESGEKVRYIGANTPEKGKSGYDEATEFNRAAVEGQTVELVYDEQCRDKYGRLLAYVCADATMINEELLREGYAKPLHIPPNTCNRDTFDDLYGN